jgi:MATE family multidrug resistance protein
MGLAIAVLLETFAHPIVIAMGATDNLKQEALKYLRIRALAAPAVLFITAGHGIFRGYQDTRTPLLITIALNLVNLVLDPIFIFAFGWGLSGAALATFIAQWCGAGCFLFLLLVTRRRQMGIHLRRPRMREFLPLLKVGGNLSVRTLSLVGALTLATAVATRIGVLAVAAHQVGSQLRLFFSQVIDCMAIASQALVARYRGAGEETTARAISNRALFWGVTIGLVLSALFAVFKPLLIRIFTNDPDVIGEIMTIYAFIVFTQPFNAVVFVLDGVFMGAGQFNYLAKAMLLAGVVSAAVTLLALPLGWGLPGVWWGFVSLMAVRALTLSMRYYSPKSIFL